MHGGAHDYQLPLACLRASRLLLGGACRAAYLPPTCLHQGANPGTPLRISLRIHHHNCVGLLHVAPVHDSGLTCARLPLAGRASRRMCDGARQPGNPNPTLSRLTVRCHCSLHEVCCVNWMWVLPKSPARLTALFAPYRTKHGAKSSGCL